MGSDFFDLELEGRVVVMGIGSESRGDDAAGPMLVERLEESTDAADVLFLDCGNVPENYTSKVKNFDPNHIIVVDVVHFGGEPGEISIVDPSQIVEDSVSTHRIPLSKLIEYLEHETGANIILMGIQPRTLEMGEDMSDEIKDSIKNLASILKEKLVRNENRT